MLGFFGRRCFLREISCRTRSRISFLTFIPIYIPFIPERRRRESECVSQSSGTRRKRRSRQRGTTITTTPSTARTSFHRYFSPGAMSGLWLLMRENKPPRSRMHPSNIFIIMAQTSIEWKGVLHTSVWAQACMADRDWNIGAFAFD